MPGPVMACVRPAAVVVAGFSPFTATPVAVPEGGTSVSLWSSASPLASASGPRTVSYCSHFCVFASVCYARTC
jgi:hypothetical protein